MDPSAMIVDIGHGAAAGKVWVLCSRVLLLSCDRLLITSDAETAGTWQLLLDRILEADPKGAIYRISWNPSHHGGRPFAHNSPTGGVSHDVDPRAVSPGVHASKFALRWTTKPRGPTASSASSKSTFVRSSSFS